MSLLSKSEIQFLQNQKQFSKSYKYKLKSVLKKKLSVLLKKELPLLSKLFSDFDITTISNNANNEIKDLTKYSNISNENTLNNLTKISKENSSFYSDASSKIGNDIIKQQEKLVACEGLEGSKTTHNDDIQQKATETSNFNIKNYKTAPGEGFEPGTNFIFLN